MEDTRKTNIGVNARVYEQVAIKLALSGHFPRVTTSVVDRLCERCATSGKCITDAYDSFVVGSTSSSELDCPGWCELLSHLKSLDEEVEASTSSSTIGF